MNKFDIILGNPPYNNKISASGTSSDMYDEFIINSDLLSELVLMITPTRWFNKGDKKILRDLMINKGRLSLIKTNNNFFSELNIRGGVSYFLLNKKDNKVVLFNGVEKDLKSQYNKYGFIFFDQETSILTDTILSKINGIKLSDIFNSKSYFGLKTNHKKISKNGNKCYFSSRQKNTLNLLLDTNHNRYYSYVDGFNDKKNKLNKWKLMTPCAYGYKTKSENTYNKIGGTFISNPGEICTETFIFFDFESYVECYNLSKYFKTKFVKYLISIIKIKQDVTAKIFSLIPLLDFTFEWTDEKLRVKFNITTEEWEFIESVIPDYY